MRLGESPSIVVTALPCAADTGIRQENMRSPSMCTMQAPHWPAPQPNLVPVSFSSSRSTHSRRVLSGALTLTGLPLTVKLIAISTPFWFATCYSPRKIAVNAALPPTAYRLRPYPACGGVSFELALATVNRTREHHEPHDPESSARRGRRAAPCCVRRRIHGENSVPAVAGVLAGRRHGRRQNRVGRGTDGDARQRGTRYLEQFRSAGDAGVLADGSDHEACRRQPRQHRAGDGFHQGIALRRPFRRDAQGLLPERQLSGERAHHGDEFRPAGHRDRDPGGRSRRRPLLERQSLLGRRPDEEKISNTEVLCNLSPDVIS